MTNDKPTTLELVELINKRGHELDLSTPLFDRLSELSDEIYDAKRGTTFMVRAVSFECSDWRTDGEMFLGNPVINVYGTMTFGERTDSSACVVVRPSTQLPPGAYTKSTAWDGRNWKEMPEGARKRVAQLVSDAVRELVPDESYWRMVAREAWLSKNAASMRSHLSAARREMESALTEMDRIETVPKVIVR